MQTQQNILWQPHPKQAFALARSEFEILYGGARGGGKSACGIAFLLYNINHPKFRALVIRRNSDDLKDWLDRSRSIYEPLGGIFKGNPSEIHFPSGSIIRTGHLKDDNAYTKYQGHEYHNIVIEELTQISRLENYLKLISSCRSTIPELKPQIFCTTNPGNIGHQWVKERWVDVAPPDTPFSDPVSERTRIYVPARVEDNPSLYNNDPDYVRYLNSLPTNLRKAWRDGSWDDFEIEGAFYTTELNEALAEGRIGIHPYNSHYPVQTWWDLGVGVRDFMAIWFTQMIDGKIYILDYEEFSQRSFSHVIPIILKKPYIYDKHFPPHDIERHDVAYDDGRTRVDIAKDHGLAFEEALSSANPIDRVSAMQELFNTFYFHLPNTSLGINRIKAYKRIWDDRLATWKSEPDHDDASHAADAIGSMALYIKTINTEVRRAQRTKATEHKLLHLMKNDNRRS